MKAMVHSNTVMQQEQEYRDGPLHGNSLPLGRTEKALRKEAAAATARREIVRNRLATWCLRCNICCHNHHRPQEENGAGALQQKEQPTCVLVCVARKVRHVIMDTKCKTRLNWVSHVWYNFRSYHFGIKRDLSLEYDSRSYALNFERDFALEAYREVCRKKLSSVG